MFEMMKEGLTNKRELLQYLVSGFIINSKDFYYKMNDDLELFFFSAETKWIKSEEPIEHILETSDGCVYKHSPDFIRVEDKTEFMKDPINSLRNGYCLESGHLYYRINQNMLEYYSYNCGQWIESRNGPIDCILMGIKCDVYEIVN